MILESNINIGEFGKGKYIFGITSGAYGVVEGSPSSTFSSGNELMITILSGRFLSGEVIRDEDDNSIKIATDNTISHFIVKNRSSGGYSTGSGIAINGVSFDTSKVFVNTNIDGFVINIDILNRNAFTQTYSQPPTVTVDVPESGSITQGLLRLMQFLLEMLYRHSLLMMPSRLVVHLVPVETMSLLLT